MRLSILLAFTSLILVTVAAVERTPDYVDVVQDCYQQALDQRMKVAQSQTWGLPFGIVFCDIQAQPSANLRLKAGDRIVAVGPGCPLSAAPNRLFYKDEPVQLWTDGKIAKRTFWGAILDDGECRMADMEVFDPAMIPDREKGSEHLRLAIVSLATDPVLAEAALARAEAEKTRSPFLPALGAVLKFRQAAYDSCDRLIADIPARKLPDEPAKYIEWIAIQSKLARGQHDEALSLVKKFKFFNPGIYETEAWQWAKQTTVDQDVLQQLPFYHTEAFKSKWELIPVGKAAGIGETYVKFFSNIGFNTFATDGFYFCGTQFAPEFYNGEVNFSVSLEGSPNRGVGMANVLRFNLSDNLEDYDSPGVINFEFHPSGEIRVFRRDSPFVQTAHFSQPWSQLGERAFTLIVLESDYVLVGDGMEIMRGSLGIRDPDKKLYSKIGFCGIAGAFTEFSIGVYGPKSDLVNIANQSWAAKVGGDNQRSLELTLARTEEGKNTRGSGASRAYAYLRLGTPAGIGQAVESIQDIEGSKLFSLPYANGLADAFLNAGAGANDIDVLARLDARGPQATIAQIDVALLRRNMDGVVDGCKRIRKWYRLDTKDWWFNSTRSVQWLALGLLANGAKGIDPAAQAALPKIEQHLTYTPLPLQVALHLATGSVSEAEAIGFAARDPAGGAISFYLGIRALAAGNDDQAKLFLRTASRLGPQVWEGRMARAMILHWDDPAQPAPNSDF